MKKTMFFKFGLLLAMSMVMLVGCKTQQTSTQTKPQEVKNITVGTSGEYYPWCFKKDDNLQGFEVDTWNEIGKRAGYKVEYKLGKFAGLMGMLDAGQVDTVAHQMSTTEERRKKYDFSETYAYSGYSFVIKKDANYNKVEDLKGKKVGVMLGGNGEKTLKQLNNEKSLNFNIVTYDGTPMEKDVEMGRIDAAWYGTIKAKTTIEDQKLNLKLYDPKYVFEINQYPFRKEDKSKQKIEDINKAIKAMQEDGTLTKISQKWFKEDVTKKQ